MTETKVRNPKTGRMINIDGSVFKTLIKDPTVVFDPANVAKIAAAGHVIEKPTTKTTFVLPERIKQRFLKKIESYKKRNEFQYIDKAHEEYCKTNKFDNMVEPLESTKTEVFFPYSITEAATKSYFLKHLDDKNNVFFLPKRFEDSIKLIYNNYNKHAAMQLFDSDRYQLDTAWFKANDDYIKSLSVYDAFTVIGYTNHSHFFISKYLRGKMTPRYLNDRIGNIEHNNEYYFPFFMQAMLIIDNVEIEKDIIVTIDGLKKKVSSWIETMKSSTNLKAYNIMMKIGKYFSYRFWVSAMELYKDDLKRIIANAPRTTKRMVVFRGVQSEYFVKEAKDSFYKTNNFMSATLKPYHATLYQRDKRCCFKRIVVPPGSRILFITGMSFFNKELEVLINIDSVFYIKNWKKTIRTYGDQQGVLTDVCLKNPKTIEITDAILV